MQSRLAILIWALLVLAACSESPSPAPAPDIEPFTTGPYAVASTHLEVDERYAGVGDDVMHRILLGDSNPQGGPASLLDILAHPEAAWVTEIDVPAQPALYGPVAGKPIEVVSYVMYPSGHEGPKTTYAFPYHDSAFGTFDHMLGPTDSPVFAEPNTRYPLVVLSHGSMAHGIYDVDHAQDLASHGYIVAVITYGEERFNEPASDNAHIGFLRPLITREVIDDLLTRETFGRHIDADNIGVSGFSFGGFTALAVTGGPFLGQDATAHDPRITASVAVAPWVGNRNTFREFFAFGEDNRGLSKVTVPTLVFYGTEDRNTTGKTILPAVEQLGGPRYVVEFVNQTHDLDDGAWEDRNNWELLFFNAHLKQDAEALETLRSGNGFKGGSIDRQVFEFQSSP